MSSNSIARLSIFQPGINCAAVELADHVSVIIDGEEYFADLQEALLAAKHQVVFIGWDFDTRVSLQGGNGSESLRAFIVRLLKRNKTLRIYILKWNFGALKILLRGRMIFTIVRWMFSNRLRIKFDGMHPIGASHHQKLVIIDGGMAFCGGIDVTSGRWDTREHLENDPRRVSPDGEPLEPWHDISMALSGPAASRLHDLASERWERATGKPLPTVENAAHWSLRKPSDFESVTVAIARTRGEFRDVQSIRENEALFLDMIATAKNFVYVENQYFASRTIAAAIARRLKEEDPPEFVVIMPQTADGWLEQVAMDTARSQLVAMLATTDAHQRFRIYHPFTEGGTPVYVHAKLMIVDDRIIRIGSSNMNNRSLGFDSECDVAIDASANSGQSIETKISEIRAGLIAEHLNTPIEEVHRLLLGKGKMIAAIETLRGTGRSLRPFEQEDNDELAAYVASQNLLDPVGEDQQQCESLSGSRRLHRRIWDKIKK
ncbi:hypothetical protein CBP31_00940 [Oceanisphaera profunda]|uniref:PLD phosphodiesterase domain-containing protein n=1 Tax=Oceanisphaera profunda TaxID=1416627 RepID=A0A1Y0D221_9GAMM|nr:phospholipase D-like domain-containing protein [Oceanisphaera profunda]ART81374.1 hypothetical protein CBP31_00940 [Oceanisphaera profunda]